MKKRKRRADTTSIPYKHGVPLESAIARRDSIADNYDLDFGHDRVFPELIDALLEELPEGAEVLEVGAATGLLTRPLLEWAGSVTALEPSAGMLRRLLASDVTSSASLITRQGMVEDLGDDELFDVAVVTFTPRRGLGLSRLFFELTSHVRDRVVMLLDEDVSMDWAYLARSAAKRGLDVRLRIVCGSGPEPGDEARRAVVLVVRSAAAACVLDGSGQEWDPEEWVADARVVDVPYPAPRGAASRLVRYVLSGGDRALRLRTDAAGVDRLYGNLRTAVHRLGRDRLTVRRDGDTIQVVRLPSAGDVGEE